MMRFSPMIEPAVPVFGAHQGAVRLKFTQAGHLLRGAGAEVARLVHVPKRAAGEHEIGGAVGGEQRHGDSARAHAVPKVGKVFLVVAVAAVFVFYLHHQNVSALGDLMRLQKRHQAVIEGVHPREIPGIGAAQRQAFLQKPPRKSARLPFGADVRPRAHNRPQPQLFGKRQVGGQVEHAVRCKRILRGHVRVPRHIGLHGVEAAVLEL